MSYATVQMIGMNLINKTVKVDVQVGHGGVVETRDIKWSDITELFTRFDNRETLSNVDYCIKCMFENNEDDEQVEWNDIPSLDCGSFECAD